MIIDNKISFTSHVSSVLIDIILSHPLEKLTLEMLSEISGFSKCYLSRFFKKHVGLSPGRFVKDVYLEHAAIELNQTKKSIYAISLDAGYNSQQSFSRAFKNKFCYTPNEFRRISVEEAKLSLSFVSMN
ncbi:helix-turn-helix domain-containing protein [Enterobacter kobei]|uniref:helix-turn-helix domain-containing protein n=1 Tax=Enterobacter kobei TaxID=208224 RepID=UPI000992C991|nr:AraC family transcriptional regulator [Enterobacter kobei]OOV68511.1 hypothetical protein B1742_25575 [Enterobacter kobei]